MVKIEYNNAKFINGILSNDSGSLLNLKFSKTGRISFKDPNIACKRPNQYAKKMGIVPK